MGFRNAVEVALDRVRELAESAATLKNKNLSDVLKAAGAKLDQALQHPDVDRVDADEDQRDLPIGTGPADPVPFPSAPPPDVFKQDLEPKGAG